MTYLNHTAKLRALTTAHVASLRGCPQCDRLLDACRVDTSARAFDALREHHRRCPVFRHNGVQGARYLAELASMDRSASRERAHAA